MFDADTQSWAERYQRETDFIPDPMILRVAELFIGGRTYVRELAGPDDDKDKKVDEAWSAIERNLDGLLAFFDALVTRERIPLIDYDVTFPSTKFHEYLGDIVFDVHPGIEIYQGIKNEAIEKIKELDFESLPEDMLKDMYSEMGAFGYEWFPDPGIDAPHLNRIAAGFVLGGIIFGGYAQATGTQHLLQTKRSRMFAELSVPQDEDPLWGFEKENELFQRLSKYVAGDPDMRLENIRTPPTVLPYLIRLGKPPGTTTEILSRALELRENETGKAYRKWRQQMRARWALGDRDVDAEAEVDKLVSELEKRLGEDSAWAIQLDLEIQANVGVAEVKINAKDIRVGVPNKVRNWIVDFLPFRGYRKLLLQIVLDQRAYENLTLGLNKLWYKT